MTADPFAVLRAAAEAWGLRLDDAQVDLLRRYGDAVLAFNRKANLTAAEDGREVALRHIADGLACVPVLKGLCADPAPEILDVGSGAGFIGIAVKVAWPQARVTLMEPRLKRYGFLSSTAADLRLKDIALMRRRAEDRRGSRNARHDLVVARALAPITEVLSVSLPWAKEEGHLVVYQSAPPDPASPALSAALAASGAVWKGTRPYRLPHEDGDRFLALFSRKGEH